MTIIEIINFTLTKKQSKRFRKQFSKRNKCYCGFKGIHKEPIQAYTNHSEGWEIEGELCWLYITCPKCGYGWSLWKLGVKRERY